MRMFPSPQLTQDVLRLIFVDAAVKSFPVAQQLASVSREWRSVALSTSSLWNNLDSIFPIYVARIQLQRVSPTVSLHVRLTMWDDGGDLEAEYRRLEAFIESSGIMDHPAGWSTLFVELPFDDSFERILPHLSNREDDLEFLDMHKFSTKNDLYLGDLYDSLLSRLQFRPRSLRLREMAPAFASGSPIYQRLEEMTVYTLLDITSPNFSAASCVLNGHGSWCAPSLKRLYLHGVDITLLGPRLEVPCLESLGIHYNPEPSDDVENFTTMLKVIHSFWSNLIHLYIKVPQRHSDLPLSLPRLQSLALDLVGCKLKSPLTESDIFNSTTLTRIAFVSGAVGEEMLASFLEFVLLVTPNLRWLQFLECEIHEETKIWLQENIAAGCLPFPVEIQGEVALYPFYLDEEPEGQEDYETFETVHSSGEEDLDEDELAWIRAQNCFDDTGYAPSETPSD